MVMMVTLGAVLGLAGGLGFGRIVEGLLFQVRAFDPLVLLTPLCTLARQPPWRRFHRSCERCASIPRNAPRRIDPTGFCEVLRVLLGSARFVHWFYRVRSGI
jgi:hypothetical protein